VAFLALPSPHLQLGRGAFGDNGSGSGGSTGSAGGSLQAGSRAGGETETGPLDLRLRGSHPATPVFTTDADAPAYWQGAIYTDFDGTSWGTASLQRLQAWSLSGQRDQLAPPDPFAVAGERLVTRTDTAQVVSASPLDVVLAPGRPTSYVGPGRVIADSTGTAHLVEGISAAGSAHASFTVTSTQPVDASELRAARGVDLTDPAFTATPADLPVRVGQLASSLTAGSATRLEAVDAVEQYLRTHEAYTLDSPVPAVGEDAVDDFVFVSHLGFCEQFATAAVVMLRSVGIPSRLVTGYAFGDTETSPGKRVFRQEDLHAWVQVWFPGVGWVDSDPTAGAVLQPASTTASQRLGAAVQRAWHRLPAGRLGALGVIAVLAVGGALLAASGRRWAGRRRRLAGLDRGRSGDGPVLAAYLRLDVSLVGAERARDPAETLREVAGRLGGLVATSSEVAAAMSCLERESYGVDPPSPAEIAMAVEVFDRLRVASGSQPVALAFHSLA
jgi:transglutaminase-like putative cysteine protease